MERRAPDEAGGKTGKLTGCVRFPDTKAGPGPPDRRQRVARAMKLPELSKGDLADRKPHGFDDRTPLWVVLHPSRGAGNAERKADVSACREFVRQFSHRQHRLRIAPYTFRLSHF